VMVSRSRSVLKMWTTADRYSSFTTVEDDPRVVVHFALDGRVMVSQSTSVLKIWDSASGECLTQFKHDYDPRFVIEFSPNSEFAALRPWNASEWTIWNIQSFRRGKKFKCDSFLVALSSDGTRFASVSTQGSHIYLWCLSTGKCLFNLELDDLPQKIMKISFAANGSSIEATTEGGYTKSWLILPANLPNRHYSSNTNPPLVLLFPLRSEWMHQPISAPNQWLSYTRNDEWIVDRTGTRVLWLPPDRRDAWSIDVRGKMVAVGTESGRLYMVDFSDTFSS